MDVSNLGQVFTPDFVSDKIISLKRNNGSCMEPSCGDGAIASKIDGVFAIEYDKEVCPDFAHNMDFFDYGTDNKYDTIVGNPPYVKHNKILKSTAEKLDYRLFNEKSNLYLFFIEKCIRHLKDRGELIFIVPRDFLKSTSSVKLNSFMFDSGTITNIVDYGDMRIFKGFNPNCIIFRFEKGNYDRRTVYENIPGGTVTERRCICENGQFFFLSGEYTVDFKDIFFVKVGGVSGADHIFRNEEWGNMDFVCSDTRRTGKTRRMVYNTVNDYIIGHERELRDRNIMKITDDNWWMWGRDFYKSDRKRIYVNSKTRERRPFFVNDCKNYDGSVLAIFPKDESLDINELCEALNSVNWDELGFICDGRHIFSQRSLENTKLPSCFNKYIKENKFSLW